MATVAGSPQLRLRRPNHSSSGSCNTGSHRVGNGVVDGQDWGLPSAHDGAADDNEVDAKANLGHDGPRPRQRRLDSSSFRWWTDEYRCAALCIGGIVALALVLWHFDGKLAPHFEPGIELDMIVIAIMTLIRVTLGSIVESCICQGAWIWVSKSHQARTRNRARLEDFKLFDEASRGFLGSLALLWRLKGLWVLPVPFAPRFQGSDHQAGSHLSCLGALIIVVTHGFETFSQQMFVYVQNPTAYTNDTFRPAPAPFRSDY
ncbi:arginase family protein [Ophiocordyceps sinensis CO18]|uniref:Arginase family protein n=1 Tax=Ophiocordyceps sinensis (strain Co18 / CGMCC 3.14243) TaxID=911162 RepID=T5A619_OPHSC|nr:arginase family protein [Ophiocordyceps sinensis CO18]